MSSISNNIISSLGAGSGVDTSSLVEQLTAIERAPQQDRIDAKTTKFETQISDYGTLRSSLATLQDAAQSLTDRDTFYSKSASYTDSDALIPTSLDSNAPVGDYSFEVLAVAQSQSLSSAALFSDPADAVGKGTLTFRFGAWEDTTLDTYVDDFTVNAEKPSFTITIDDSNNSLTGLAEAINNQDAGVQASVVNSGSGYKLLLTAPSGASNELEIIAADDDGNDIDDAGLSRFAFGSGAANQQMVLNQSGVDASFNLNGLNITRSSNNIDDVLDGFDFTLAKAAPGDIINLTVFDDSSAAEEAVRSFVDAYNEFQTVLTTLTGYDEEKEEYGSLYRDPTTSGLMTQLKNVLASAVPGVSTGFTTLTNVGIRTEKDGSLSINENDFTAAFNDNFDLVQKLFAPIAESSSDKIVVNSFGAQTVPGTYEVAISAQPSRGDFIGGVAPVAFPLTILGTEDYSFQVTVDGVQSGVISLSAGTYDSATELAAELQAKINGDSTLNASRADVDVTYDTDHFVFTSRGYGTKSAVSFDAIGVDLDAKLNLSGGVASQGTSTAGTFDGVVGFGSGNVLLPELKSDPYGLTLIVKEGATSATISYSRGFGQELSNLIDQYLQSSGIIATRESNIDTQLSGLETQQERLDRRITAYNDRLTSQFIAMENILRGLKGSSSFLDNIGDYLPFTASKK